MALCGQGDDAHSSMSTSHSGPAHNETHVVTDNFNTSMRSDRIFELAFSCTVGAVTVPLSQIWLGASSHKRETQITQQRDPTPTRPAWLNSPVYPAGQRHTKASGFPGVLVSTQVALRAHPPRKLHAPRSTWQRDPPHAGPH